MTYADQIISLHTYGGEDISEFLSDRLDSHAKAVDRLGLARTINRDREQLVTELRRVHEILASASKHFAATAGAEEGPPKIYARGSADAYAVAEHNIVHMAKKLGIDLAEIKPLKPDLQENAPAEPAFKVRAPK